MHSSSDAQKEHFVLEHSPDSKKSRHPSFASKQGKVPGLVAGGGNVSGSFSVLDQDGDGVFEIALSSNVFSTVLDEVGIDVLSRSNVFDGEGIGLGL